MRVAILLASLAILTQESIANNTYEEFDDEVHDLSEEELAK